MADDDALSALLAEQTLEAESLDQDQKAAAAAKPRRGPGRPPKKAAPPPLAKNGIVDAPFDVNDCIELAFGKPMTFKALFAYFRGMKAHNVHCRCTPEGITFRMWDSEGVSRIFAVLPGGDMNHYYCDATYQLGISRESVDKIFASIDASYHKITLAVASDDTQHLHIIFKDSEIDKVSDYKVELIDLADDAELSGLEAEVAPASLAEYPLSFTLGAKQFKKSVTDAHNIGADAISIEKYHPHPPQKPNPLQLICAKGKVKCTEVFNTDEKIKLRADIKPGEFFKYVASVPKLKPLASVIPADEIEVICARNKDLVLRSEFECCTVFTFVKLR